MKLHHMYSVGLDVDTRAYFTAATCAISLYLPLRVNPSSKSFSNLRKAIKRFSTKTNTQTLCNKIVLYNNKIGINYWSFTSQLKNSEKIKLTPRVKSILIGLILKDAWLQKKEHWNTRIGFKQSIFNFPYFWHV